MGTVLSVCLDFFLDGLQGAFGLYDVDVRLLEDDAKFIRSLLTGFLKVTRLIFGVWTDFFRTPSDFGTPSEAKPSSDFGSRFEVDGL